MFKFILYTFCLTGQIYIIYRRNLGLLHTFTGSLRYSPEHYTIQRDQIQITQLQLTPCSLTPAGVRTNTQTQCFASPVEHDPVHTEPWESLSSSPQLGSGRRAGRMSRGTAPPLYFFPAGPAGNEPPPTRVV